MNKVYNREEIMLLFNGWREELSDVAKSLSENRLNMNEVEHDYICKQVDTMYRMLGSVNSLIKDSTKKLHAKGVCQTVIDKVSDIFNSVGVDWVFTGYTAMFLTERVNGLENIEVFFESKDFDYISNQMELMGLIDLSCKADLTSAPHMITFNVDGVKVKAMSGTRTLFDDVNVDDYFDYSEDSVFYNDYPIIRPTKLQRHAIICNDDTLERMCLTATGIK